MVLVAGFLAVLGLHGMIIQLFKFESLEKTVILGDETFKMLCGKHLKNDLLFPYQIRKDRHCGSSYGQSKRENHQFGKQSR